MRGDAPPAVGCIACPTYLKNICIILKIKSARARLCLHIAGGQLIIFLHGRGANFDLGLSRHREIRSIGKVYSIGVLLAGVLALHPAL